MLWHSVRAFHHYPHHTAFREIKNQRGHLWKALLETSYNVIQIMILLGFAFELEILYLQIIRT